jgi:succinyl-CoA synthetase beta subunit
LKKLGRGPWVVKAQVQAGGRGGAGGIRLVESPADALKAAEDILGKPLVTPQTGPAGLPVRSVLVCKAADIRREAYAAVLMDRRAGGPVLVVSPDGGGDVEARSSSSPGRFLRLPIDPFRGLTAAEARRAALFAGFRGSLAAPAARALSGISRTFFSLDALLVEVNPLAEVKGPGGRRAVMAIDAKIVVDDNGAFRHDDLAAQEDVDDLSPAERLARRAGVSYVRLGGDIGCLVNGAGLAMATADLLCMHGGAPANFLDVGGGARGPQVAEAFRILLDDERIRSVLVNIFGGIMKCDVIARGLLEAIQTTGLRHPLVVRLEGNRAAEGRRVIAVSGLNVVSSDNLADAARQAVEAAKAAS